MKRIILSFIILSFSVFAFSSEVDEFLKATQEAYEAGDLSTAIQNIDSARSIIEKENFALGAEEYIELNSWDIVKIKKSEYIGKKVRIIGTYCGANADGTIIISNISTKNTYEESLIDKLLSLQTWKKYTFYGTVIEGNSLLGPKLHIEAIE